MEVKVLLFGILAEYCQSQELFLSNVTCTDEVQKHLASCYPFLLGMKYLISVDRNIIHSNTSINNNSEVALLPPFSGG
jgi:molybdopterin synthase sulfur carrier subunit